MTPQDTRARHIDRGASPTEPLSPAEAPLEWDLVEYIVEIERVLGGGMSLRSPVVVSYRQACETSLIAPNEQSTALSVTHEGIKVGAGRGSVSLRWSEPFSMVLSAWLISDEEAELYVKLHPRGEVSARKGLGFSVIWPQSGLCAEVPLKEERLPYLEPAAFTRLWPLLLTYAGIHGFEDRPWVGGFP